MLSVIMCTRNRAEQLRRVLDSAAAMRVPQGLSWEFLLVDNGSTDHTAEVVASTGSTNADLAARARAGEPAGLVLATDHQVSGRGRLGRTWTAPSGSSIAMSVLLRPERDPATWTWLPLLAGLAVADSLRAVAGVPSVLGKSVGNRNRL